MLITHEFILLYFFNKIISCFIYIFQSKFLTYVFFSRIFRTIIHFQLNQEILISQLILLPQIFFLSSFSHLLQIIERTNVFSKMCDILGFLSFLYLSQITQQIFFILIFLVIENILVLFYHFFHICQEKINLYNLKSFYLLT